MVRSSSVTVTSTSPPPPRSARRASFCCPGRLAALVHLEQREQGHRLGQPVLVGERLVEVEAPRRASSSRSRAQPPLERDGRADVAGVGRGRRPQQVADRLAEPARVVGLRGGVERDPAQLRRQRRRAVEVAAPVGESAPRGGRPRRGSGGTRASAPAARRPPPPGPAPTLLLGSPAAAAATSAPAARRSGRGTRSPPRGRARRRSSRCST